MNLLYRKLIISSTMVLAEMIIYASVVIKNAV
jgi:hypothetical protein